MEAPSMETVYQAINALYNNPNGEEKEKASMWLGDVQKSIHSWKIADELLQQKKDIESCYFAAQTMRAKVQNNLTELPSEAVPSLRDSLMVHLASTAPDTYSAILTQLSLALADLALQMSKWPNSVTDLIQKFTSHNDYALLELLTVLPQEVDSTRLKLGENRREEIKSEFRSNSPLVCKFLSDTLVNTQNTNIGFKVIKCMTSWIQVNAIDINEISQNAVVAYCLQIFRDYECSNKLHESSADCICALLQYVEQSNISEEIERLLFDSIASLENSYHMAVAHEEEEKVMNYARVFTDLGECFLSKIVNYGQSGIVHYSIKALELALLCVGYHDYEVAEVTFALWYNLSEEVYRRDNEELTQMFRPYIERLVAALARHCQCEPDIAHLPQEEDDFYEFRMKVMDLIKDVVFIVGSSSVFRQMFAVLHQDLGWEQTEAALFVMQSIAKNILPDEQEVVPGVVSAIVSLPGGAHVGVRHTCALLLGELGEWLRQNPAWLSAAVRALLAALHEPTLGLPAARALYQLASAAGPALAPHVNDLGNAVAAADELGLSAPAIVALLQALSAGASHLPPEQLSEALRVAVGSQLSPLLAPAPLPAALATERVDRAAALFRDLSLSPAPPAPPGQHPAAPALHEAWPALAHTMNRYVDVSRVIERVSRAIRYAVRCVGLHAEPLLPDLAQKLAEIYLINNHSSILYLSSVLVDELSTSERCVPTLLALLNALLPPAFLLLRRPQNHPDTVDDLFRLCVRFLQRAPLVFLSSGAASATAEAARACVGLQHREAHASVMRFLLDLVAAQTHRQPDVAKLAKTSWAEHGHALTVSLVEAAVLHVSPAGLPDVADVLTSLRRRHDLTPALRHALAGLPAGRATDSQRDAFLTRVSSVESSKEMTRILRDFARLYQ